MTLATELERTRGVLDDVQGSAVISPQVSSPSLRQYPFQDEALGILALCHGNTARKFITGASKVPRAAPPDVPLLTSII